MLSPSRSKLEKLLRRGHRDTTRSHAGYNREPLDLEPSIRDTTDSSGPSFQGAIARPTNSRKILQSEGKTP